MANQVIMVVMSMDNAREIFSGPTEGMRTSRPILMLPYVYDKAFAKDRTGNGLVAYVQSTPREDSPQSFSIIRCAAAMECSEDMMNDYPQPTSTASVMGNFNPSDMINSKYSRLGTK
jgi:hypothetical protein